MFEKRLTLSRITCCYLNWKNSDLIRIFLAFLTRTCSTNIKVSGSTNLFPFHSVWNSHIYLFADDLNIFTSAYESLVQYDNDSLQRWCSLNCLQFHPLKCKALNFAEFDENMQLMSGSHCLPYVGKIEDLGFIVTEIYPGRNISISNSWKAAESPDFLRENIPHVISVNRKKSLLKCLLLPILLYGIPVWCPSVVDLKRMELFQYKAIGWIKACPSYVSGLSQLDLLPISYLLIRDDIILLWNFYNNQIDVDSNLATMSLPTRSSTNNLFVVPKTHKFSSDHNFFMRAPVLQMNSLANKSYHSKCPSESSNQPETNV